MRRLTLLALAGVCLAPLVGLLSLRASQLTGSDLPSGQPAVQPRPKPPESTCGRYGTTVEFLSTPAEAARRAKQEQQLVFVLHVSGLFEDPQFT